MKASLALLFSLLALTTAARAGGKTPTAYIGLHVQGEEYEGAKFVQPNTINGEKKYFRLMPEVALRHFSAFQAFMAEDGASYGAALKLNDEGMRAMQVMCSNSQGRLARTVINGKLLDIIHIDRVPADGYVIVWGGLTEEDFKIFGKKLKRLDGGMPGEGAKKKKSR